MAYFVDMAKKAELERDILFRTQQLPASGVVPYLRGKMRETWEAFTAPMMRVESQPPKLWDKDTPQIAEQIMSGLGLRGSPPNIGKGALDRTVLGPITLSFSITPKYGVADRMATVLGGTSVQWSGKTPVEDMVLGCLHAYACQALQDKSLVWLSNRFTFNKDSLEPLINAAITDLQMRIPLAIVCNNFEVAKTRVGKDVLVMVGETNSFLKTNNIHNAFDLVRGYLRVQGHNENVVHAAGVELSEKIDIMQDSMDFYRQNEHSLVNISDTYNNSGAK
jgi:hypothetical protein